jgi:hypothetical protein
VSIFDQNNVMLEKTQRAVRGWATAELVKNLVILPFNDNLSNDTLSARSILEKQYL